MVFSLLVMFTVLAVVVGISGTSVVSRKTSSATDDSTRAFQAADSGMEKVLAKIKIDRKETVDALDVDMNCDDTSGTAIISGDINGNSDYNYKLTFVDESDAPIVTCNDTNIIGKIKSIGNYKSVARAVEIGIDIFDPCGGETFVVYGGDTYDTVAIGDQCWLNKNLNIADTTLCNGAGGTSCATEPSDDTKIERYCWNNNVVNCNPSTGALYTWHEAVGNPASCHTTPNGIGCYNGAIEQRQGICPAGWHIPDNTEWEELKDFANNYNAPPNNIGGDRLKDNSVVGFCLSGGAIGTANCGILEFLGYPSGFRIESGDFLAWSRPELVFMHSSSIDTINRSDQYRIRKSDSLLTHNDNSKRDAFSVRCIKNPL